MLAYVFCLGTGDYWLEMILLLSRLDLELGRLNPALAAYGYPVARWRLPFCWLLSFVLKAGLDEFRGKDFFRGIS